MEYEDHEEDESKIEGYCPGPCGGNPIYKDGKSSTGYCEECSSTL